MRFSIENKKKCEGQNVALCICLSHFIRVQELLAATSTAGSAFDHNRFADAFLNGFKFSL